MKTNLLLILFSLLTIQLSFAQLTVSETEVSETLELGVEKDLSIKLTNTSSEMKTVKWSRTQSLPQGWITYVCDPDFCYDDTKDEEDFDIEAGAEETFKITFLGSTQGSGTATITISDSNDASDMVQVVFNASTTGTSDVDDLITRNIRVYPNPTSNNIYISNTEGIESMEVYNIIGKKVRSFSDVSSATPYNIEDLPKGMYLIRLLDNDSDVVTTKRISKR